MSFFKCFCAVCLFLEVTAVYAASDLPESEAATLSAITKQLGSGKLTQSQYEVDLNSGLLWMWRAEVFQGNYVLYRCQLPKERIIDFEKGVKLDPTAPDMGFAFINGKFYEVNPASGRWRPSSPSVPHLPLSRFNYFSLSQCNDYRFAVRELKQQLNAIKDPADGAKQIKALTEKLSGLENQAKSHNFSRGDFNIDVTSDGDLIKEWTVSNDEVTYRKIINDFTGTGLPDLGKIEAPGGSLDDSFKALFENLNGKPVIGAFFGQEENGEYAVKYVVKDGPAEKAGLALEDKIESVNGKYIKGLKSTELDKILASSNTLKLVYKRNGQTVPVDITKAPLTEK